MNWWIIAAIVVIILIIFKFKEIRHKFMAFVVIMLIVFTIAAVLQIRSTTKISLASFEGWVSIGKVFVSWIGSLFHNIAKITGFAVNQNWSINATNIT